MKSSFFLLLLLLFSLTIPSSSISSQKNRNKRRSNNLRSNGPDLNFSCDSGSIFADLCQILFLKIEEKTQIKVTATKTFDSAADLYTVALPAFSSSSFVDSIQSKTGKELFKAFKLDTISAKGVKFMVVIGKTLKGGRFTGTVSFFGINDITFDFMVLKEQTALSAWVGFSTPFKNLVTILQQYTKVSQNITNILDTFSGSTLAIMASYGSIDFKKLPEFKPNYIDALAIESPTKPSLILQAKIKISPSGSKLSTFLAPYFKDNSDLTLEAKIFLDSFEGSATINNLVMGKHFTLNKAGFKIKIEYASPATPTFSIEGELEIKFQDKKEGPETKLVLAGALKFTPVDFGFNFNMKSIWSAPFGLTRVHFGNLLLDMMFSYAAGTPTKVVVGAEIAIGKECYKDNKFDGKGHCLMAKGVAGLDMVRPEENAFYVEIAPLGVDVFFKALIGDKQGTGSVKIPQILNEALSLPENLIVAFSPKEQKLGTFSLKQGFLVSGAIKIFKTTAKIYLELVTKPEFKIKASIESSVINFGKILTLEAQDKKTATGPKVDLEITSKSFKCGINSKVTVLGISAGTVIDVNETGFTFEIEGALFESVFKAKLKVTKTVEEAKSNKLSIEGSVNIDASLIGDINAKLLAVVKDLEDQVNSKIDKKSDKAKKFVSKIPIFGSLGVKTVDICTKQAKKACAFASEVIAASVELGSMILEELQNMKSMFELKSALINVVLDENLQDATKSKKTLKIKFDGSIGSKPKKFEIDIDFTTPESIKNSIIGWVLDDLKKDGMKKMMLAHYHHNFHFNQ